MSEHTPTPWENPSGERCDLIAAGALIICRVPNHPDNGKNWKADAAFIVKAVNNHDALVKALERIIDLDTHVSDGGKVHDHGSYASLAIDALGVVGKARE